MGMKLPIAATSIVCSACIAVSVAAPTVDLPEKAVKNEAGRSVTREYKLLAVTDPVNGAVTLVALSLEDLGAINKFFVDKLLNPLGTLAASPLNIPTGISNLPATPADDTPKMSSTKTSPSRSRRLPLSPPD